MPDGRLEVSKELTIDDLTGSGGTVLVSAGGRMTLNKGESSAMSFGGGGVIAIANTGFVSFSGGTFGDTLVLENHGLFSNGNGVFTIRTNSTVRVENFGDFAIDGDMDFTALSDALFFNKSGAVLRKIGGSLSQFNAKFTVSNAGRVEVTAGELRLDRLGNILTNIQRLEGGEYSVSGGQLNIGDQTISEIAASVSLSGTGQFSRLSGVRTIASGCNLSLGAGVALALDGGLTSSGGLLLATGASLNITGNYTQNSSGILTIGIDGLARTAGRMVVSGAFN
jgi:hypothetical protein